MRKLLILLFCVFCLVSCKTVYIAPELPQFEPERPTRPVLAKVEETIPKAAVANTALLIGYIKELETYSNSWEAFYIDLSERFNKTSN